MYNLQQRSFWDGIFNHPPALHELRPELEEHRPNAVVNTLKALFTGPATLPRLRGLGLERAAALVNGHADEMAAMGDDALREYARALSVELHRDGFSEERVARSFALIRETSARILGMRHYDSQIKGGWALLKGTVAEMETGEGKTLTATLAAGTAALAGVPVHVISVNDYLTARDAEETGPLYRALGLTVGCVVHDVPVHERRSRYAADVTYCTNKEVAFDYLRDVMAIGADSGPLKMQAEQLYSGRSRADRVVMRGLHYAIVDEADSLLVDEARTPLIISGSGDGTREEEVMRQATAVSHEIEEGEHYRVDVTARKVDLTESGKAAIGDLTAGLGPMWTGSVRRNEYVRKALTARCLFDRDVHYIVRDGKVQIVDEYTGRVMADRSWEQGLHQLIEIKECCEVTKPRKTLARISYQRFFRRYLWLAGMTGTAREVRGEMWSVYDLPVVRIDTNRPLRRVKLPVRVFRTVEEKYEAILERVREMNSIGRPVLIGTRTVAASEELSRCFSEAGLEHRVLNAKNDPEEAEIVSRAGEPGMITVATNMAGRGTDIKLAPGIAELGGLHVILTELHEAGRIDRQLAGRCARQGDPGSHEDFLSLEDSVLKGDGKGVLGRVAEGLSGSGGGSWKTAALLALRSAQKRIEKEHESMRRRLFRMDIMAGNTLSFTGRYE